MKKRIVAVLMSVVMAGALAACGSSSDSSTSASSVSDAGTVASSVDTKAEESSTESTTAASSGGTTTIRMALPTWVGYGALYVAQDKGFFEEQGLDVELSIIEGLAERKQALISGNLDGLATSVDVLINLEGSGIPMGLVWLLDRSNGSDGIVATSDCKSPADLKGKNVAAEIGSTDHYFLLQVLKEYGLTEDDINIVPMNVGDAGTAFVAGQVDAAATYDPYLSQGVEAGGVAFTTADYDIDLMDAIGFSDDFIEQNPDAVQAFVTAVSEASSYIAENRDECVPIIADGLKLEGEDVSSTMDVLESYDLSGNIDQMGADDDNRGKLYDTVAGISQFYADEGLNDGVVEATDLIDPDFVRALNK